MEYNFVNHWYLLYRLKIYLINLLLMKLLTTNE